MEIRIKRNTEWANKFVNKTKKYAGNNDWIMNDSLIKDFILGKDIAGVGQSYFPSSKHNEIFNYIRTQEKLIDSIKALQDVSDITPLEEFQKGIINAGGGRKCMLAVHAMLCALNPNLLCNVVDEKRLDDLYDKLIAQKEEEIGEQDSENKDQNQIVIATGQGVKLNENVLDIDLSKLGNEDFWDKNNDTSWYKKSNAMNTYFNGCASDLPWATLMALEGNARVKSLSERLELQKNMILTGAPGTGKTYLAKQVAAKLIGCKMDKLADSKRYGFVQFHPSYDYTDFVEGLRPKDNGGSNIGFERQDGIFKAFCKKAAEDKNESNKYVFVIDEINRGEISKIFGELFFSIDPGYRGKKGIVNTQYQNLIPAKIKDSNGKAIDNTDSFNKGFYVPNNVYVIGTMNDIDRSVESMDFAFRRRFAFVEITASESEAMIYNSSDIIDSCRSYKKDDLISRMESLNKAIIDPKKGDLTTEYQIGGAYFLKIKEVNYNYNRLWNEYIKGVLVEYYRGNPEQGKILKQLEDAYNCTPDN